MLQLRNAHVHDRCESNAFRNFGPTVCQASVLPIDPLSLCGCFESSQPAIPHELYIFDHPCLVDDFLQALHSPKTHIWFQQFRRCVHSLFPRASSEPLRSSRAASTSSKAVCLVRDALRFVCLISRLLGQFSSRSQNSKCRKLKRCLLFHVSTMLHDVLQLRLSQQRNHVRAHAFLLQRSASDHFSVVETFTHLHFLECLRRGYLFDHRQHSNQQQQWSDLAYSATLLCSLLWRMSDGSSRQGLTRLVGAKHWLFSASPNQVAASPQTADSAYDWYCGLDNDHLALLVWQQLLVSLSTDKRTELVQSAPAAAAAAVALGDGSAAMVECRLRFDSVLSRVVDVVLSAYSSEDEVKVQADR